MITPNRTSPSLDQTSPSATEADTIVEPRSQAVKGEALFPLESGAATKNEIRSLGFNFETQRFETKIKSVSSNGQSALEIEIDQHVKRLESRANMLAKELTGQEAQLGPRMVLTGKVLHPPTN